MTFDDQLKRSFNAMSERLRAAVDREVEIVVEQMAEAARTEREAAVSRARDDAAREATGRLETEIAAARHEARAEGLAAGTQLGRGEGVEDGRRQGIQEGRQQSFEEGRQQGFEEGRQQGALDGRREAEQESREALAQAVAVRAEPTGDAGAMERLSEAVRAISGARSLSEILETLLGHAGQASGQASIWVVQSGRLRHWRPTGIDEGEPSLPLDDPGAIGEAARTNLVGSGNGTLAVPIAMAGHVVAVLYTNPGASGDAVEIMARYAARCLEAVTAFKAARALTERPGATDTATPATGGESTVEADASARRYARLLVSEIKLYHPTAVVDGRRDRDLATRLGGEIARARVLYDERVPSQVRERTDFFRDELVQTLAGGDATLLQLT
jgi:hypothetical protein